MSLDLTGSFETRGSGGQGHAKLRGEERQREWHVFAFAGEGVEDFEGPGAVATADCGYEGKDRGGVCFGDQSSDIFSGHLALGAGVEAQLLDFVDQAGGVAAGYVEE